MIENDKLENYLFIRHKLFRKNTILSKPLIVPWTKATIDLDFGKDEWKKVKVINNPMELTNELKDCYIKYLEMKVYKQNQLLEHE